MKKNDFENLCKQLVLEYFYAKKSPDDTTILTEDQIYFAWYRGTEKNNYAIVHTTIPDGLSYYIIHSDDKNETQVKVHLQMEVETYSVKGRGDQ